MLRQVQSLTGHEGRVWHASWSPDGTKVASCGEDKTVRVWSLPPQQYESAQCLAVIDDGQSRTIRSCEWSPDGRMIAAASFDGTVIVWQTQDRSFAHWDRVASLEGHENEVKSIAWSNDGMYLATCGRDKKVWIWEKLERNDFECAAVLDGHSQDVKFLAWHPHVHVLFSASYDDTIKIWTEDSGDWYCAKTLVGHSSTVWGLALDADGKTLASCSDDQSVFLWQCDSATDPTKEWRRVCTAREVHQYPVYSIDWNVTFNKLVTGGGDNQICILAYQRTDDGLGNIGVEYSHPNAHDGDVNCVRWNPNFNPELLDVMLSAGDDGCIKIWRLQL